MPALHARVGAGHHRLAAAETASTAALQHWAKSLLALDVDRLVRHYPARHVRQSKPAGLWNHAVAAPTCCAALHEAGGLQQQLQGEQQGCNHAVEPCRVPVAAIALGLSLLTEPSQAAGEAKDSDEGHAPSSKRQRLKPRELARVLHVSDEAAALILDRCPDLKSHPANRVQAALKRFAQLLKVDDKTAGDLAIRQPRILLVPADQLTSRVEDISVLLKVSAAEARDLVRQQPGLVTHQHETLRARLAAFVALIKEALAQDSSAATGRSNVEGVPGKPAIAQPGSTAVNMFKREPGLLAMSHSQLVNRVTALSAALGSPGSLVPALQLAAQAPTSVLLPPSRTASIVATLASLLSLTAKTSGDLLIRQPRIILHTPEVLTANFRSLSSSLGVERSAVACVCREEPGLLLLSDMEVLRRVKALATSLGVTEDRARQLVRVKPALLLREPDAVQAALAAARKRGDLPK